MQLERVFSGVIAMFLAKSQKKTRNSSFSVDKATLSTGAMLLGYFATLRAVSWLLTNK